VIQCFVVWSLWNGHELRELRHWNAKRFERPRSNSGSFLPQENILYCQESWSSRHLNSVTLMSPLDQGQCCPGWKMGEVAAATQQQQTSNTTMPCLPASQLAPVPGHHATSGLTVLVSTLASLGMRFNWSGQNVLSPRCLRHFARIRPYEEMF
jgi:hypothetical protein